MSRPGFVLEVDERTPALLMHEGEGFRLEKLPLGSRVVYPPESLPAIRDLDARIRHALLHPLGCEPLPSLLAGGIYFFGRLARKAPGRRSMRGPRAAYSVIREGCEVARRNGSTVALVLVPDC